MNIDLIFFIVEAKEHKSTEALTLSSTGERIVGWASFPSSVTLTIHTMRIKHQIDDVKF